MQKFLKYICLSFIVMTMLLPCAEATDNFMPVRVGISDTDFRTYIYNSAELLEAYNLNVMDSVTGYTAPTNESSEILKITNENNHFSIYIDEELVARNLKGPIVISSRNGSFIKVKGLKRKGRQAGYRGSLELIRSSKDSSKFSIVNVLSLKNYLRGVVPNEMPVRFGLEALKAQTIAARNYAVTPRVKAYEEFDVCDSVACQVYFGANTEDSLADRAIEETDDIIALDRENKPILALYSSTAGGYTESYEYAFSDPKTRAFPSNDIHYLTAVPDQLDFGTLETEEKAQAFYTSSPKSYDDNSPYYRWSKEWTVSELENVLKKTLPAQSKTGFIHPAINSADEIGKLISIKAIRRGASGKIIQLELKTDRNTYIVEKELVIRRCFQKNGNSLPSANFIIQYTEGTSPSYKFIGGGFGHGVGLSQWGAGKMSSLGYKFDEILQHYYTGVKLATIPVDVISHIRPTESIFYTNNPIATVYIYNPDGIKKLKIIINNRDIEIKLNEGLTSIDISRYIQQGINKISYLIVDENIGFSKKAKAFVEIKGAMNNE